MEAGLGGADLPEDRDEGEYGEFLEREGLAPPRGRPLLWTVAAAVLVAAMVWSLLRYGSPF
jgi:hypothetical protein